MHLAASRARLSVILLALVQTGVAPAVHSINHTTSRAVASEDDRAFSAWAEAFATSLFDISLPVAQVVDTSFARAHPKCSHVDLTFN